MHINLTIDIYFRWTAFLSVSIAVGYAIFRPMPPEMIFEHSDKAGHVIAFLALSLTGRLALSRYSRYKFWLSMFVLAFILEYLQGQFRPLRLFSLGDVTANMLGVLTALTVFICANRTTDNYVNLTRWRD